MLVLSRKVGESVIIGVDEEISITVLAVHGDRVRLGFAVPRRVLVYRSELRASEEGPIALPQAPPSTNGLNARPLKPTLH